MKTIYTALIIIAAIGVVFGAGYIFSTASVEDAGNSLNSTQQVFSQAEKAKLLKKLSENTRELSETRFKITNLEDRVDILQRRLNNLAAENRAESTETASAMERSNEPDTAFEKKTLKRDPEIQNLPFEKLSGMNFEKIAERKIDHMAEDLGLTELQKQDVKDICEEFRGKRAKVMSEMTKTYTEKTENGATCTKVVIGGEEMRERMEELKEDQDYEISKVLSPEQYEKYEEKYSSALSSPAGDISFIQPKIILEKEEDMNPKE